MNAQGSSQAAPLDVPPETTELQRALRHHEAGRIEAAAGLYRHVLTQHPDQPTALHLLGVILGNAADPAEGAALLERYLALVPGDPFACHSLGVLRERQGDAEAAIELFHRAVTLKPDFALGYRSLGEALRQLGRLDEADLAFACALTLIPDDALARNGLGDLRYAQGRYEDALAAFEQAARLDPSLAIARCNRGIALAELGRVAEAETAYLQALALDPACTGAHRHLADLYEQGNRLAEAADHRIAAARACPVRIEPCRRSPADARILFLCGWNNGDVPIDRLFDRSRFTRVLRFLTPDAAISPPDEALPDYDIVFNTIADPDRNPAALDKVTWFAPGFTVPLLNQPAAVALTRRDVLPDRMAGIDRLHVPATRRATRHELSELSRRNSGTPMPFLVRPTGSHGGKGLSRIDEIGQLADYLGQDRLGQDRSDEYYLSVFAETADPAGYYRKYRFIFVDGGIYPYHLAIMKDWMVHYWRADMDEAPWMRAEEQAFLEDYERFFPGAQGAAIREVARRLGLDYGGMDCTLAPDGTVVLFEANAAMLVHDSDKASAPYREAAVARIREAVSRMVMTRV